MQQTVRKSWTYNSDSFDISAISNTADIFRPEGFFLSEYLYHSRERHLQILTKKNFQPF